MGSSSQAGRETLQHVLKKSLSEVGSDTLRFSSSGRGGEGEGDLSVVLCDKNGLCYGAEPPEESRWAGSYRSIMDKAKGVLPDAEPPVVLVETDRRSICVREVDSVVVSVTVKREQEEEA